LFLQDYQDFFEKTFVSFVPLCEKKRKIVLTGLQDLQDFFYEKPLWPLCLCVRKKTENFF